MRMGNAHRGPYGYKLRSTSKKSVGDSRGISLDPRGPQSLQAIVLTRREGGAPSGTYRFSVHCELSTFGSLPGKNVASGIRRAYSCVGTPCHPHWPAKGCCLSCSRTMRTTKSLEWLARVNGAGAPVPIQLHSSSYPSSFKSPNAPLKVEHPMSDGVEISEKTRTIWTRAVGLTFGRRYRRTKLVSCWVELGLYFERS